MGAIRLEISSDRHRVDLAKAVAVRVARIHRMADMHIMRRLTASVLAAGLVLMAWSICASGAMTMSEMMCCAEHHGECKMAGMAVSCCGTDQHTDVGMLEPERPDDKPALATYHSPAASTPSSFSSRRLATSGAESHRSFRDSRTRPHLAHTVLLI